MLLIEQQQPRKGCVADHADGVDFQVASTEGGGCEKGNADKELPGILHWRGEVLAVAEQQRCGSKESYDGRPQARKDGTYGACLHVLHEHAADQNHQDE